MLLLSQALSALGAGLRLPRAREATDEALIALLEPLLDETVRNQLRIARAVEVEDYRTAAALQSGASKRGKILQQLQAAVRAERYSEAARLAAEMQVESARRQDVTQDEGSYDQYLDQDDWYARQLAAEREKLLREKVRAARRRRRRRRRGAVFTISFPSGGRRGGARGSK